MVPTNNRSVKHSLVSALSAKGRCFRFSPQPLPLLLGVALALGGCSEGSVQSPQTMVVGEADELTIQPIQVCDDKGGNCAQVNLFADITAKILAQANLKLSFLPTNRLNASRFLSINDNSNRSSPDYEFYEISRTGASGAFGRNPNSTEDSGPINVWFVDTIEALNGFTQFGLAWVGANGVVISKETIEFGANGRTDTLAHEIGHNLGLRHTTLGAGGANNLLTDGDRRNIPNSVDDIAPDGSVSQLTDAQIAAIKNSPFVTSGTGGSNSNPEVSAADAQLLDRLSDAALDPVNSSGSGLDTPITQGLGTTPDPTDVNLASVPEPGIWLGLSIIGVSMVVFTGRLTARSS